MPQDSIQVARGIHDTVYVVVRDTVVRVAAPFHEPVALSREHACTHPTDFFVMLVGFVASVATIVVAIVAIRAYLDAKKQAKEHLRAHLLLVTNWIQGPVPGRPASGWSPEDITPRIELEWRRPTRQQVLQTSAAAFSQVTLLQNVFLPRTLTMPLVALAQSIESFNGALARYEAFKMSDVQLYLSVDRKLDDAVRFVFPGGLPQELTPGGLNDVLVAANFTPEEGAWCANLLAHLRQAHLSFIGDSRSAPGLFQFVQALTAEYVRLFGPLR